tara:strand:- start:625 stop:1536 length:912 start_codon:yes stop_codon:yes gene_type:complete
MQMDSIVASTTQFQTLLIAFVLIVAVIYFFIEMRRVDMRISVLDADVKKLMNQLRNPEVLHEMHMTSQSAPLTQEDIRRNDETIPKFSEQNETDDITNEDNQKNVVETEDETGDDIIQSIPNNIVETPTNPIESVLSFSLGQTNIINSISEEIASAAETMMTQPSEITIITANEPLVSSNDTETMDETTIEDITGTSAEDKPVGQDEPVVKNDVVENDDDSITMERIDDITEEEVNDTISIDDPILESDNEQPLLTEITAYTEYQNHTIKELKDILTDMNLPTSGNKTKLIQRIVSNKNKISN